MIALRPNETIGHLVFRQLQVHADRVLIMAGSEVLTGAEIAAQAASVAGGLADLGVRAGDVVLVSRRDPVETVLGYLATWYLGASPAVSDFRTPAAEIVRLAQATGARLSVVQRNIGFDEVAHTQWDANWRHGPASANGIACGPSALAAPAHIGQTSGTTGQPKIVLHHQGLHADRLRIRAAAQAEGSGKLLIATSLQFHPPLASALTNLIVGDPVQFHPILFTPDSLIEVILSSRARTILLPPPVIRRLVHHVGPRDTPLFGDLKVLRSVGGPALPEDKIAAYQRLSPGYTMAYSSIQSGMVAVLNGPDVLARPETTGRVLDGVLVEALDDDGRVLPVGVPGRLRIASRTVADSSSPSMGAAPGTGDEPGSGFSMPGDVGFVDAEGFLTIQGRQDDVILRGGVNVSIGQLEGMILQCPGVEDVAVLGIPDVMMWEEIAAAVVGSVNLDQVRQHCTATIPVEKRPRKIAMVPALPYSISGKLLRRKIDRALFE